jgi:hypothetical protein
MPIVKGFPRGNTLVIGSFAPHDPSKLWLPDSVKKKGKEEDDKRLVTLRKIEEVRKKW